MLRKLRIPVEVCLTSNLKTGSVPRVAEHHLGRLAAAQHPVLLATDDSGLFATTLSTEYSLARTELALNSDELIQIARRGFEYAFVSPDAKRRLLGKFDSWLQEASKYPDGDNSISLQNQTVE